jgi:uncharacterized protein with GYD domain
MPYYLLQIAYTPQAWSTMVKNPQDRISTVRPVIESMGGKLHSGYLSFGEYDLVAITEYPENVSAAAFAIAAAAGGAIKSLKTTPLMTTAEGVEAMRKAQGVAYRPPA